MDIPQVLAALRPNEDWGPNAQTGSTYAELAATWRGTSAVPTQAEMLAKWDAIVLAAPTVLRDSLRSAAVALATSQDRIAQLLRAELLVTMDELNLLRQRIRATDAAVAAASSLADLKTRWAALAPLPDRTAAQIKPALAARAQTPDAD